MDSIERSDLKDNGYSEMGIVRGLIIEPLKFEIFQNEVRNALKFAKAFEDMVKELNDNPNLLFDVYKDTNKLGSAFETLIFKKLEVVEKEK